MNKAKELLQKLPEPFCTEALKNFDEEFFEAWQTNEVPIETAGDALRCSFNWGDSPQRYDYWFSAEQKHGHRK